MGKLSQKFKQIISTTWKPWGMSKWVWWDFLRFNESRKQNKALKCQKRGKWQTEQKNKVYKLIEAQQEQKNLEVSCIKRAINESRNIIKKTQTIPKIYLVSKPKINPNQSNPKFTRRR